MPKMVMTPYKLLRDGGVLKTSTGASIPNDPDNYMWQEYQEWLAKGGIPEPIETADEIAYRTLIEEIDEHKGALKDAFVWQFRMILELFKLLKQFTACTNADVNPELMAKALEWIARLDRLKEIDE